MVTNSNMFDIDAYKIFVIDVYDENDGGTTKYYLILLVQIIYLQKLKLMINIDLVFIY